eukprot:scaffold97558_cov58-Phaeocystis_antarctica.AAC.2
MTAGPRNPRTTTEAALRLELRKKARPRGWDTGMRTIIGERRSFDWPKLCEAQSSATELCAPSLEFCQRVALRASSLLPLS